GRTAASFCLPPRTGRSGPREGIRGQSLYGTQVRGVRACAHRKLSEAGPEYKKKASVTMQADAPRGSVASGRRAPRGRGSGRAGERGAGEGAVVAAPLFSPLSPRGRGVGGEGEDQAGALGSALTPDGDQGADGDAEGDRCRQDPGPPDGV